MTVEEAIKIWQKTKSPYLKRDMEKFIHKHKKGRNSKKIFEYTFQVYSV